MNGINTTTSIIKGIINKVNIMKKLIIMKTRETMVEMIIRDIKMREIHLINQIMKIYQTETMIITISQTEITIIEMDIIIIEAATIMETHQIIMIEVVIINLEEIIIMMADLQISMITE